MYVLTTRCRSCKKPLRAAALYCYRCGSGTFHIRAAQKVRCLSCGLVHNPPGPATLAAFKRARITNHQ